jgi:soluble lytic murein transglycosylase
MYKLILIIGLTAFLAWGTVSYADIYKYVDENGVAHFTNMPDNKGYKKIISERPGKNTAKPVTKSTSNTSDYHHIINSKAMKYNIAPALVKAVISTESNWDPSAVSQKGAMGLMQLMPFTARDMGVSNPFNPEENIEGGTKYLKFLLDKFDGDISLALAAYNAGPAKIEESGGIPRIQETQKYVKKVLSIYGNSDGSRSQPTLIYKIVSDDGTVLYTNTPLAYDSSKFSKF